MALLAGYICSMAATFTVLAVLLYGFSGLVEHPMQKVRQHARLRPPIVQTATPEKKVGLGNAETAPVLTDVSTSKDTDDMRMPRARREDSEKSKLMRRARYEKRKLLAGQREHGGYPIALGYEQQPAYDAGNWPFRIRTR